MLLDEPPNDVSSSLSVFGQRLRALTHTLSTTQLIHKCTQSFHIDPDKLSLSRIRDSVGTLQSSRTHRLQGQRQNLKALNRQLSTLQSTHALTVQSHNPTEHAAEILRLDTEKFRIAKEASQLETEGERLEGEVERTRLALEEVESQGAEGGEAARRVEGMDDETLYVIDLVVCVVLVDGRC
jgi:kinetochore protein Spc24